MRVRVLFSTDAVSLSQLDDLRLWLRYLAGIGSIQQHDIKTEISNDFSALIISIPGRRIQKEKFVAALLAWMRNCDFRAVIDVGGKTTYPLTPDIGKNEDQLNSVLWLFRSPVFRKLLDREELFRRLSALEKDFFNWRGGGDQDVEIAVYLDTDDEKAATAVFQAMDRLAVALGYAVPHEGEIFRGSFWMRTGAWLRRGLTSPELKDRLAKVERALELNYVDEKQAKFDSMEAAAVAQLVTALENIPAACLRLGSLFAIKYHDGVSTVFLVRTLSQVEMRALERFPEIQTKPHDALSALSLAVSTHFPDGPSQ